MDKLSNLFHFFYFLVGGCHILAILLPNEEMLFLTKPMLMSILILFMVILTWTKKSWFSWLIILGLVFSLSGDVLMMLQGKPEFLDKPMFLFGLGSFLVTHLFYLAAFIVYPSGDKGFVRVFPKTIWPFLVFFIWINYYLWDHLGDMQVPVIIYSAVISLMAISALNLSEKMDVTAFRLIFTGVILFMFSDLIIALNKFRADDLDIPYPAVIIMATYIIAQYYIVKGAIRANYLIPKHIKTAE